MPEIKGNPGRKPTCKPSGRKATAKVRPPKPGVAGSTLRNAVNTAVVSQSGRIADALVKETVLGNVGSAKLLIEFTGAMKADEPKKRKRRGLSLLEQLALEPQWDGPRDTTIGAPFGPLKLEF